MNLPGKDQNERLSLGMNQMAGLAGQIAGLTLILILGAVFGGIWLDKLLGTKPVIMLILVIAAGPLSIYLTYKMALRTAKSIQMPPGSTKSQPENKEDETGE